MKGSQKQEEERRGGKYYYKKVKVKVGEKRGAEQKKREKTEKRKK